MRSATTPRRPDRRSMSGRAHPDRHRCSVDDALLDRDYDRTRAAAGAWRRIVGAPMLKDGVADRRDPGRAGPSRGRRRSARPTC